MQDLVPIAEKIAAKLIERRQTIAVAESSTGGLISASLLAVPGASAYTSNLLRAFRGFSNINEQETKYHDDYHSLQMSLNRRMRHGLQFGANYTYSMSFTGNAGVQGGTAGLGLRLNHNADGT